MVISEGPREEEGLARKSANSAWHRLQKVDVAIKRD